MNITHPFVDLGRRQAARRVRRFRRFRRARGAPRLSRWACTRCSIAARKRPASPASTAANSTPTAPWAMSPAISTATRSIAALPGTIASGHVRYSTTGETALAQRPAALRRTRHAAASRSRITAIFPTPCTCATISSRRGAIFQSTSDTEVIIHLVATSRYPHRCSTSFIDALRRVEGAYSLIVMTPRGHDRLPRSARHPAAGDGQARRRDDLRLGNGRARRGRREFVRADRSGRDGRVDFDGKLTLATARSADARPRPCIFEHVYFCAPRFDRRRPLGLSGRARRSARAGEGSAGRGRPGHPGARFAACPRRSAMPSNRASRSSSASSARIMSAAPSSSRATRSATSASSCKHNANRALIKGKRIVLVDDFDRPRHHQPEDRPDDARGRRGRSAYADRQPADHATAASTASTRPSATSCSPRRWTSRR